LIIVQNVVSFFSGRIRRLFGNSTAAGKKQSFKLMLHGFPGGTEGLELIVRFCYNGGRIDISPSNVILLQVVAKFMEINENQTKKEINENQTKKYLENTHLWTWSELLDCLKQCQELLRFMLSSYVVQEILDAVVEKISTLINISSPFQCSDNSSLLFSGDIISTYSSRSARSSSCQAYSWLQDLEFLSIDLFEKVSSTMISRRLDRRIICAFLLHYQKVKCVGLLPSDQKCKIVEILISSLCSLDGISCFDFPFRSLCDLLRICLSFKMRNFWVKKVEIMIGARLDEATLDDLLVRARGRKTCAYDASLILRLLKVFLGQRKNILFVRRLEKVGFLIDLYLAEVAPDRKLKPSNFLAIALCLPGSARESHDRFFEAVDMFFKVHKSISKEEKMKICSALNYDKMSSESLVNIAKNAVFPTSAAAAALFFLQSESENRSNYVANLELRSNSSFFANEDEQILAQLRKGKEYKKLQKKFSRCC
ncbi:BTB/POZ domain-containing protein at3g22104, partial [Phtheirospermum japonicum]